MFLEGIPKRERRVEGDFEAVLRCSLLALLNIVRAKETVINNFES